MHAFVYFYPDCFSSVAELTHTLILDEAWPQRCPGIFSRGVV